MRSTFMGLETARRGMFTQQSALHTTGHNISNANTPGYSRQRINFTQTTPYPSVGMNRPQLPGQMGTGVEAGSVQRIRESFLDVQFRTENTKMGYYGSMSESLTKMEEIMNEPSESGLHSTLEKFWNALQDLSSHTENTGARDVVAASGQMVADTLNYYYNSLTRVQDDIGSQAEVKVEEINSIVAQIDHLNKQIAAVEPHGYLPNDLYDERDMLVDSLSSLVNVKVSKVTPDNYGNAKKIADGLYNIEIVQQDGKSFDPPINLVSATKESGVVGISKVELEKNPDSGLVAGLKIGESNISDFSNLSGGLAGLIKSYGYETEGGSKGIYPEMLDKLNKMAEAFAREFNEIHKNGFALGAADPSGLDFFQFTSVNAAQSIKVNQAILDDSTKIAAGKASGASGDNANAQELADLRKKSFNEYTSLSPDEKAQLSGSLDSYYSGIIGRMGVDSQSAKKDLKNSSILADSVEQNRQSVSAVSLDEEMTNMIRFQHAYNASARNITVVDEMLDKIINGMGVVGR
ncbi:flagellar hook-associated protein FlgK [Bacillus sp. ISL-47]|uniref:flagellar hook-associated protein FlgK n=1 Tax=Bacillus sp. ISL-47 TaxID=2819130 RepID=UPI001BE961FE|nr:flagellar hook-associated protein FlgK [Bacillus sp. ISL-47]MBT2687167.1 flagellar hook-associated protein FlgK [Bacillus sp. ISL-47]MBT2709767.1 flagellar hook-associated protein FlgK [Pseudomonas sp. ISL-84]